MGKLDGKVAIVTGGGSGIGKGIASGLAAEGAQVVIAGRRAEALNDAVKEFLALGYKVAAIPTDVTSEAQVDVLFKQTVERFQRVDILVNNAGAVDGGALDELSVETWDKVIAANLRGPFLCTRSAMRLMKAQGGGKIINIGSISAQRPRMNSGAYATSKFGIWGLTLSTALEGRDHGIAACCLHPGNVQVERNDDTLGAVTGISNYRSEPKMAVGDISEAAVLMATLPPHVNMLEAIVLPVKQAYLGRG
jgi:NAD(P)-dependent dehydrogenase (short-subunit alcohol dehydrogenase family)